MASWTTTSETCAPHACHRVAIQRDDRLIALADKKESRRLDMRQCITGEVRPSASRDDSGYVLKPRGGRHQRCTTVGTGPEQANRERLSGRLVLQPFDDTDEASREQRDIESQVPRALVDLFLLVRQQVDEQRASPWPSSTRATY